MNGIPLKYLVTLNPETLSETTHPDVEFDYIDIGGVGRDRGVESTERVSFGEAPSRARRVVRSGDVIVSTVRTYLRAVAGVPDSLDGAVCSTGFAVLRPTQRVDPAFLRFVASSRRFVDQVVARSAGISYPAINASDLVRIPVPCPSLDAQVQIADFLDRECTRIDELAELLATTSASTRGAVIEQYRALVLNGTPLVPLKYYAQTGTGHTPSRSRPEYWRVDECSVPWFTLADVHQIRSGDRWYVEATSECVSRAGLANSSAVEHPAGTVLLSRTASVGFSAVMKVDMAVSQDFMTWTCGPHLLPEYLLVSLQAMQPELRGLMYGSTHKTIYMPDLHALRAPMATLETQRAVVAKAQGIRDRASKTMAEMGQLQAALIEYRDALITEAVSGDLDVTNLGDSEMAENLAAVQEHEAPEVLSR